MKMMNANEIAYMTWERGDTNRETERERAYTRYISQLGSKSIRDAAIQ
jgi:hypothetical protein